MKAKDIYAKPEVKILTDFGLADISEANLEKPDINWSACECCMAILKYQAQKVSESNMKKGRPKMLIRHCSG